MVGRITAQVDRAFNEFHASKWGMFGFLEFEDDLEIVQALLAVAEDWVRAHGCDRLVGPMNFQLNDEGGVMIEGFEREPLIREPWNPPYYQRRCEEAGLAKAMDLYGWDLSITDRESMNPILPKIAERAHDKYGITIRKMSRRHLRREMDEFAEVYNAAWSHNWGFVPYSKTDLDAYAIDMQLVFSRDWFMIAEADGQDGRDGDHDPRHPPGLQEDERPAAAARLAVLPDAGTDHRPPAGRLSRRDARVPAHRRRGRAVSSSTSTPPSTAARSTARRASSSRSTPR